MLCARSDMFRTRLRKNNFGCRMETGLEGTRWETSVGGDTIMLQQASAGDRE